MSDSAQNVSATHLLAGFLHWKALTGLLFSCDEAATETRTPLYTHFMRTLTTQLSLALADDTEALATAAAAAAAEGEDPDSAAAPSQVMSTLGMDDSVQEMLQDSFLKQQAIAFLELMIEERASLPADLWHEVCTPQAACCCVPGHAFRKQHVAAYLGAPCLECAMRDCWILAISP